MKVLSVMIPVCLLMVAWTGIASSAETKQAVPIIEIEMPTYDFREASQGEVIIRKFRVFNRGRAPLEIRSVKPGCGCSAAQFDQTIPAGGQGKIILEVRTKGYQGKIHKTARVYTNDPEHPQATIGVKGMVWVPVQITPRHVYLKGNVGEEVEKVVQLTGQKKPPLVITIDSVSISDKVVVELQEIKENTYQLKVANKVKEQMTYDGQIRLVTNYPEEPEVVIRVSGQINDPFKTKEEDLSFGRLRGE